ncbi:MAG: hypothetical protein LAT55_13705 [Opitutales bacterium]|nr:hypothetical protein [Opitutales bacterium]
MFDLQHPLPGRILTSSNKELPCALQSINDYRCLVQCDENLEIGESLILLFDKMGRLEGRVGIGYDQSFGINLTSSPYKRADIRARIDWIRKYQNDEISERRQGERVPGSGRHVLLRCPDQAGERMPLIDISRTGAHVQTANKPVIGEKIFVGRYAAKVVRHTEEGIAVNFCLKIPEYILYKDNI